MEILVNNFRYMYNNRIFYNGIFCILVQYRCYSLFTDNILIQSVIFVITSTLLLVLTKPLIKKFVKTPNTKSTNVYGIIGKEGIVIEEIDALNRTRKSKSKW